MARFVGSVLSEARTPGIHKATADVARRDGCIGMDIELISVCAQQLLLQQYSCMRRRDHE